MPRDKRRTSATGLYHVMMRGISKEPIFGSNSYKKRFINIVKEVMEEESFEIMAYCIMSNHVHLLMKAPENDFAKIMKRINIKYAQFYNKTNDRVGHVFQDRFKSEVIESSRYYLELIRYIHNNPVKAGLVEDGLRYSWSSYHEYVSKSSELVDLHFINKFRSYFHGVETFIGFHTKEDANLYLDTPEDVAVHLHKVVEFITEMKLQEEKVSKVFELTDEAKEELATQLLSYNYLKCKFISECSGVPLYQVKNLKKMLKKNKSTTCLSEE